MAAFAAGGHHAVDDAGILDPGECQVESWAERHASAKATMLHVGPGCRVGPVQLNVSTERSRDREQGTQTGAGVQLKWAHALNDHWAAGVEVAAGWQRAHPHFKGSTLIFPVSWQATESLAFHLNLGRDFVRGGRDTSHSGAAVEWRALPDWMLVAERFRSGGQDAWRLGTRWSLREGLSLDLSQARGRRGRVPAWWTLGVNWTFDR